MQVASNKVTVSDLETSLCSREPERHAHHVFTSNEWSVVTAILTMRPESADRKSICSTCHDDQSMHGDTTTCGIPQRKFVLTCLRITPDAKALEQMWLLQCQFTANGCRVFHNYELPDNGNLQGVGEQANVQTFGILGWGKSFIRRDARYLAEPKASEYPSFYRSSFNWPLFWNRLERAGAAENVGTCIIQR